MVICMDTYLLKWYCLGVRCGAFALYGLMGGTAGWGGVGDLSLEPVAR